MLYRKNQDGVVLFMCMVMLLLLTVLGVSSVQTTSLQQRMSRNASDVNLAFHAAEAGLLDAEAYAEQFNTFPTGANGYYDPAGPGEQPNWKTIDWDDPDNYYEADTNITGVEVQPKYIVEHIKTVISDADALNLDNIGQDTGSGRTQVFRIISRGTGGTANSQAIVTSTYGKRF